MSPSLPIAPGCSLWVVDIGEPRNNDLRVVVVEARSALEPKMTALGSATPIRPDTESRAFELIWYAYVGYGVRNESYFRSEDGEAIGTDRLVIRSGSAYLTYIATTTFASDVYPGELTHWSLYADWHCIDVVSTQPPEVRELRPDEVAAYIANIR